MLQLCYFFIIIMLSINTDCLYGQTLTLLPYRQEDCETNCTHGLVSDIDIVVFKAELDYSRDLGFKYLYFQRKTTNALDFIFLQDIVVNGSVIDPHSWEPMDEHVVKITIRVKAAKASSGARIRGVLLSSNYKEIISEEQIFPEIRDSTDVKSRLLINGVEMTTNICVTHSTGSDIIIIFECDSQVLPCLIEMSATDLMVPLFGKGYVIHTSRRRELNITIKYASCTLDGQVNTIKCSINLDLNTRTEEMHMYMVVKVLSGLLVAMAVVILLLIFLLFRKRACPNLVMESGCLDCFHRKGSHIHIDDLVHQQLNQSMAFSSVTNSEGETDKSGETEPLLINEGNYKRGNEEHRSDLIISTEASAGPDTDIGKNKICENVSPGDKRETGSLMLPYNITEANKDHCGITEEHDNEADDFRPITDQSMTNIAYVSDMAETQEAHIPRDEDTGCMKMGENVSPRLSVNASLPKRKLDRVDENGEDEDKVNGDQCGTLEEEANSEDDLLRLSTFLSLRNDAYIKATSEAQEALTCPEEHVINSRISTEALAFPEIDITKGRTRRKSLPHINRKEILKQLNVRVK